MDSQKNTSNSEQGSSNSGTVNVDTAPSYVASVNSDPTNSGKPHGKSLTEGGFDSDDKNNASFNSEVGGKDDPGRDAVNDFQRMTQSASGATGPTQGTNAKGGSGAYETLSDSQNL